MYQDFKDFQKMPAKKYEKITISEIQTKLTKIFGKFWNFFNIKFAIFPAMIKT